uniref:BED-type domain-containing protein n=1 Tax=Caenorhabditis japonica TaxID=281687 RepID=A0A8R1DS90_CAEJA
MSPPSKKVKETSSRRSSLVWKFYTLPEDATVPEVKCPECKRGIKYYGSTSTLLYHLEHVHSEEYKRLKHSEADSETATLKSSEDAEKMLGRAFCTGLIPFRFSENTEFRQFLKLKPENFIVPSATKIRRVVKSLSQAHVERLKKEFIGIQKYTLCTDGYTDLRRGFNFYSLHISHINKDFERKMNFCGIRALKRGDNVSIGETLCLMLRDVGLQFSQCSTLASDAATPLVLLAEIHNLDRIHCGCHCLNLIIVDFAELREVRNIQKRVENFASHLARSKTDKALLQAMSISRGITTSIPLPLPATRWGGLHILFNQYLEHYESAVNLTELQKFLVKKEEIVKINMMRDLLKPIHTGILRLERDTSFSSEIIPTLRFVRSSVRKINSKYTTNLLECIDKRLDGCLLNDRLLCTMLIDHRYGYADNWVQPRSWAEIEKMITNYCEKDPTSGLLTPTPSSSHIDDIDQFLESSLVAQTQTDRLEQKVSTRRLRTYQNPLIFWEGNCKNFPKLATVAQQLLSSPASSSVSERTFSRCTDFLRQTKRNRAKIETLNELLTVNELTRLEKADENQESHEINHSSDEESSDDDMYLDMVDDEINAEYPVGEGPPTHAREVKQE